MIRWVFDSRRYSFYIYFWFFCFSTCKKNLQVFIYIKNTVRNPKQLPEWHYIDKGPKYPWCQRVAHARLLLEVAKFSDEISGQPMVDSGRSEGENSYDDDFDGR